MADRGAFKLTVRHGPKVEKARHATLADALAGLEGRLDEIVPGARRKAIDLKVREIAPAQQIVARAEISGPRGVRGGVDLRGDSSAEAYTGRLQKKPLEPRRGETAFEALRRELSAKEAGAR